MIEDDGKFSLSIQESENINLKMESYTIIGNAEELYNKGYADGEEYGKKNAPSEDFSVTLIANGSYEYPKPEDKYYKDLSITVAVPSDYGKGYDDGYSKGDSDGYDRGYDEGEEEGKLIGYEDGYSKGKDDGLAQRQYETWTLTLADGSTVEKEIALL